uniref:Glutathione transferase n=1 Tax=Pinguiococcus pyrenoidosus TaxID=172671 RepID=A0A7R9YBQ3_9STRA
MAQYKLKYFGFPGRGESVRLAMAINGIDFENDVVSFERWGGGEKAAAPYGGLPVLEIDGVARAQTGALLRYVGKLGDKGLYPSDPAEALKVDEALEFADEVSTIVLTSLAPKSYGFPDFESEDAKRVHRESVANTLLAPKFAKLEALIVENDKNGLIFTDHLTIAELKWYQVMKLMKTMWDHLPTGFFDQYPNVQKLYTFVEEVPEVQAWYSS